MTSYTGDVTLTGGETTPVAVEDPEDLFVTPDGADGALRLDNAEYVFTGVEPADAEVADAETTIEGDLEDGYVDGATGAVVVRDAEDAFVVHDGVDSLELLAPENVYDGAVDADVPADLRIVDGWKQSATVSDPDSGVAMVGARSEVTVEDATGDLTVYVAGYENSVRVEGEADAEVVFVGRDNEVSLGPYVSPVARHESGFDNAVSADPVPVEDVIETTRTEAYRSVTFGRAKVTYQVEADEEWCPNCGAEADAVVERRQEDAFFLFGRKLLSFEEGGSAYDCEECATRIDAVLSEDERRDLLG